MKSITIQVESPCDQDIDQLLIRYHGDAIKHDVLFKILEPIKAKEECTQCWVIDGICQNCGKDFRKNVIKAKALKKKGTNDWYYLSYNEQIEDFQWYYGKTFRIVEEYQLIGNLPPDAELVDILIVEENK